MCHATLALIGTLWGKWWAVRRRLNDLVRCALCIAKGATMYLVAEVESICIWRLGTMTGELRSSSCFKFLMACLLKMLLFSPGHHNKILLHISIFNRFVKALNDLFLPIYLEPFLKRKLKFNLKLIRWITARKPFAKLMLCWMDHVWYVNGQ